MMKPLHLIYQPLLNVQPTGSKDIEISNLDDYKQKSEMLFSNIQMILLF
ncbi:MAG: hypothetical protein ACLRQF_24800 [Thomasclavelia ramosa]